MHFHGKGLAQHTLCILCLSVVILVLAGSFNFTQAAEEKNAERESSGRETEGMRREASVGRGGW